MTDAAGNRSIHRQHAVNAIGDARINGRQRVERQVGKAAPLRLGQLHRTPRDMMRLAERHVSFADQPVGKIGRGRKTAFGQRTHPVGAKGQRRDHARHRGEAQPKQVERLEHGFLVVLHIL